jgi:CRP/FNR family cyclic AMP-dependent transcriptional regulator
MALLAGKVRISVSSPHGKEITLATLQSGEIFGEIAVLDGRERTANAIAASDCRLAELERKDVLHFLDREPGAWQSLVNVLCDRLRRTDQQLGELALLPLTSRLSMTAVYLTRCAWPADDAGVEERVRLDVRRSFHCYFHCYRIKILI